MHTSKRLQRWGMKTALVCRLRHFGDFKRFLGSTQPFSGASMPFAVGQPAARVGLWAGLRSWLQGA